MIKTWNLTPVLLMTLNLLLPPVTTRSHPLLGSLCMLYHQGGHKYLEQLHLECLISIPSHPGCGKLKNLLLHFSRYVIRMKYIVIFFYFACSMQKTVCFCRLKVSLTFCTKICSDFSDKYANKQLFRCSISLKLAFLLKVDALISSGTPKISVTNTQAAVYINHFHYSVCSHFCNIIKSSDILDTFKMWHY